MRLYEIVYVFHGDRTEDELAPKLERFHGLITADGGEIEALDLWGVRQLAYPIRNHTRAFYVVAHVRAEPSALPEFERIVGLDADVLRYLVVVNEGEPTTGLSVVAERPETEASEEESEDGDGDDDEDDDDAEDDGDDSPPEFSGGRGRRRRIDGPAIELLNYKDVSTLSRFMTEQGKILPKRTTRVSAAFQRKLGRAVKRARFLALVPYVSEQKF